MSNIEATEIKIVNVDKLRPNPKNRNIHPNEQIKRLEKIIKYQGFRSPVVVSNRSGFIVAGHGRLLAAKNLGFTEVPVIYQDFSDDDQEYAHGVADNAAALWSQLDLSGINLDLADLDPSFEIDNLGIKDFTLDLNEREFNPLAESKKDEQEIKTCPHCGEII
jgi:ParB-like chromosome segregation protein Spo0J